MAGIRPAKITYIYKICDHLPPIWLSGAMKWKPPHASSGIFITKAEHLPYFIINFKIKCLPASRLSIAFSDIDLMLQFCLPYNGPARNVRCVWIYTFSLFRLKFTCLHCKYDHKQGGLSIKNGQNRSHFTFSQRSESHHRSRSHFATPMMVLYRKWANDLGTKLPNWNTNFARDYCEVIARKGLKSFATF